VHNVNTSQRFAYPVILLNDGLSVCSTDVRAEQQQHLSLSRC
jgi:hypothetical protein